MQHLFGYYILFLAKDRNCRKLFSTKSEMLKNIWIGKKRGRALICQVTDDSLKVAACFSPGKFKKEFTGLESEAIPADITEQDLSEKIKRIFEKLQANNAEIVVSLPRSFATCRYLKIPAITPEEIESIVSLQASKYLPYPVSELITAYQVFSTDNEGYSYINLIIVHKDIIEKYTRVFKTAKTTGWTIVLSSYGLCNFYNFINPNETRPVLLIDIDSTQIELTISRQKKLLFSRSFKFNKSQVNWQELFIDEVKKTQGTYLKETSAELPYKIVLFGVQQTCEKLTGILNKELGLPVEVLSFDKKIRFLKNLENLLVTSNNSFINLIGLGIDQIDNSLNLLPRNIKEDSKKSLAKKEVLRLVLFILGTIFIFSMAVVKHLDNKARYLERLKIELNTMNAEAKPLEELVNRYRFMEKQLKKKPTALDMLCELHKSIPLSLSLINFNYEENNQIVLRGQTQDLSSVLKFINNIETSPVFKNFNTKLRYVTQKKIRQAEFIDFEIVSTKK